MAPTTRAQDAVTALAALAGVQINGPGPADIHVHDPRFYGRVLREGSLGLGEAYMDGWWDCERLDEFFYAVLRAGLEEQLKQNIGLVLQVLAARLFNMQSRSRAFQIGEKHYDTGNDLFSRMLDMRMNYSCGYWREADTLDSAQEDKLDLICRKLRLVPGMSVLDIGCGWGGFAGYAAERYGAHVTGITVSQEQVELAQARYRDLPVEIRFQDYRDLHERYDRIVSVGMIEHVGCKNYRTYMEVAARCLSDDGLFLLHTIGGNRSVNSTEPWTNKYIFPNGMLPSIKQLGESIEGLFVMEDWHNFSADYDRTLMAWHSNFIRNWPELEGRYDERFYRMWTYYLLSCAGSFRARHNQLWQIVLAKKGIVGGYRSLR